MAIPYYNLLITGVNGTVNSPVPASAGTQLHVNENTPTGRVIGKIHGFAAGEQLDQLVFTVNQESGSAWDRYEVVRATADMVGNSAEFAVGDWVVVLKAGGPVDYDYESDVGIEHISFTVTPAASYTPQADYGAAFTFRVMDVNEAPDDLKIGGTDKPIVREGVKGAPVGALSAMDEDDINNGVPQAPIHYAIVADPTRGMLDGAMFEITALNELKLLDGVELDWDTAKEENGEKFYEVAILVEDSGGYTNGQPDPSKVPSSTIKVVRVYVAQDIPNTAPHSIVIERGGVVDTNAVVAEDLAVGDIVGQLGAQDDGGVNNLTFTFAMKADGSGEFFDGGGRFEIDAATKQIKVKAGGPGLNFEGAGLETDGTGRFYRLKVIATDTGNPALSSAEQDILVYVTGVNEAPVITPASVNPIAIDETVDNGHVLVTFTVDDPDENETHLYDIMGLPPELQGAFAVDSFDPQSLKIVVADKALLAGYTGQPFTLTLTVTDQNGGVDHISVVQDFNVTINDVGGGDPGPLPDLLENKTVLEHSSPGLAVGRLMDVNATTGETFTYTFAANGDAGGCFTLDGNVLRVANGLPLDFEQKRLWDIKLIVTSSVRGTFEHSFTISLRNADVEVVDGGPDGDMFVSTGGADVLFGNGGNDTLISGDGLDELWGGEGADAFVIDAYVDDGSSFDIIMDFDVSEDRIELSSDYFFSLMPGNLDANAFYIIGAEAQTDQHQIMYNDTTGELFYDMDGSLPDAAPILIAIIQDGAGGVPTNLTAANFLVVNNYWTV